MYSASRISTALLCICVFPLIASPSFGEISVGVLTEETAKEKYGITMHARKNGDAGIKVWLEFKQAGWRNLLMPKSGWRMPEENI